MGYSDDPSMVRVDFFKPSGKWYCTEAVKWTGKYFGKYEKGIEIREDVQLPLDAFATSLCNHLDNRLSEMTAICLEPYHEFSYPLMLKNGEWLKK